MSAELKASKYSTARNRLTPLVVKRLEDQGFYHDGGGLYLQVTLAKIAKQLGGQGRGLVNKSWVFRYRLQGKLRSMGIGSFKDFSLAEARERATKLRQMLADKIDPIEERDARARVLAAQRATEVSFRQCAEDYHKQEAVHWKNVKHAAQWINTLTTYAFPKIGNLKVHNVGKAEVVSVLKPIWKEKPETASRLKQRMNAVLEWAAAKDLYPGYSHAMWGQIEKTLGKGRIGKRGHHAACPYGEVADVLRRVRESNSQEIVKLAFEFTVLNASRSGESRLMSWSEIKGDDGVWVIPEARMKAGKEHRVPLSARALELVKAAKKITGKHGLVFCHPETGKAFSDAVFTSLIHKGLELPYTMHGFRSSFRDWAGETTNHPRELLEVALAHLPGDSTEHAYWRGDALAKRRVIMDDWAAYLAKGAA